MPCSFEQDASPTTPSSDEVARKENENPKDLGDVLWLYMYCSLCNRSLNVRPNGVSVLRASRLAFKSVVAWKHPTDYITCKLKPKSSSEAVTVARSAWTYHRLVLVTQQ